MYSVIIQNRKTLESFNQHYPLFLESLNKGKFGVCRWFEQGTSVDTAVPDLCELTNDKKEWRAIIVHVEDETGMAVYARNSRNPFDFKENSDRDDSLQDTSIPLILLTYILGGIPTPIKRFVTKTRDDKKPPYLVYELDEDFAKKEEEQYEQLAKKYHYDGKKPSEIILVTIRKKVDQLEDASKRSWINKNDNTSSDFWKRNGYPSICRFLIFETTEQGNVERIAEMFRFWTSVMMLTENKVNPNALQAYRLYRLEALIDAAALKDSIQTMVGKLLGASSTIDESIQIEMLTRLNESRKLPEYNVNIPVMFEFSNKPVKKVEKKKFGLAAKNIKSELLAWDELRSNTESEITDVFHATGRVLEQSAERFHGMSEFSERDIRKLDKFEVLDFERNLDDKYDEIMEILGKLPSGSPNSEKDVTEAANNVKDTIYSRVTVKQAFACGGVASGLLLLSLIPALVYLDNQPNGSLWVVAGTFLICTGMVAFALVLPLLYKRRMLKKAVNNYSRSLKRSLGELLMSAKLFSKYLSDIASHVKGSSYLKLYQKKDFDTNNMLESRKVHLKSIKSLMQKLRSWSASFHLKVNFNDDATEDNIIVEPSNPPGSNLLYTFESGMQYEVPFNISGDIIHSPFIFIKQLVIDREEIYNDE